MRRKYPKLDLSGGKYYVYTHSANGMVYVGVSGMQPSQRWRRSLYYGSKFRDFIEEVGFDNMEHKVICICDNREDAIKMEDTLICEFTEKGVSLNSQRSGGVESCDEYVKEREKAYSKEYREAHRDLIKVRKKVYCKTHRDSVNAKNREYYEKNSDLINERRRVRYAERRDERRAYYAAHKDEINLKRRLRYQSKKSPKPNE